VWNEALWGARLRKDTEAGAALAFLEADGLVAPSARWGCTNLMVYWTDVSGLIEAGEAEELDWKKWAADNGFI